jgi:surface antigen
MRFVFAVVVTAVALAFFGSVGSENAAGGGDKKPKFTISQVMKKAMKGGLCGKVASGKASDDEKKELVELFTALSMNTPPKGEADDWKAKTGALVSAAKAAVENKDGATAALKKAANCAACHKLHKG